MSIPEPATVHTLALRSIPGYATAEERVARLVDYDGSRARALNEQINQEFQALRDGVTALADGEDVDVVAIARHLKELEDARDIELRVAGIANSVGAALRSETRDLTPPEKDHSFTYLNGVVQEIVKEVRDLHPILGAVSSASAAFRGTPKQLTAWQRLDQLVEVYEAARQAQYRILTMNNGGPTTLGKLYRTGILADAFDRDRMMIARRIAVVQQIEPVPDKHKAYADWLAPEGLDRQAPIERADDTWWPTPDRHEYLRWVAVNAHAWVPNIAQLDAADTAAQTALQITGLEHAHAYWKTTGAAPLRPLPALPPAPEKRPRATVHLSRMDRLPERVYGS